MIDNDTVATTARLAQRFNKPYGQGQRRQPFTVGEFIEFLDTHEQLKDVVKPKPRSSAIQRLLDDKERAGLLYNCGRADQYYGTAYWTMGLVAKSQTTGLLWLSEAVGPGLLIETYGAITAPVAKLGEKGIGSGLVLDERHILTNRHVVKDLNIRTGDELDLPRTPPPSVMRGPWHEAPTTLRVATDPVYDDDSDGEGGTDDEIGLDLAVVELEQTPGTPMLNTLPGIVWRDPEVTDRAYVFGYPPVSRTLDAYLLVHGGEVVNPRVLTVQGGEVVNPSVESVRRQRFFLYSSTTRPGNSGGPVVAQDGRVIGVVAHSTFDKGDDPGAPEFHRAIPGGEVIDWLNRHDLGRLAALEDWER